MNNLVSRRAALLSTLGLVAVAVEACQRGSVEVRRSDSAPPSTPPTTGTQTPTASNTQPVNAASFPPVGDRVTHTDAEWRAQLSAEQYRVLRESGTEPAFTGQYWNNHAAGLYVCAACGAPLFDSTTKFESGTGWPSFFRPYENGRVAELHDGTHGMERTEVRCARCNGHLGHVFDDGPQPTGLRYCINSASLAFRPRT